MNKGLTLIFKAVTPVHAGASEGNNMIDLPIQREINTGFPKIESTTLKGALRDLESWETIQDNNKQDIKNNIFGQEMNNGNHKNGQLSFTDVKILFFPIKSSQGIYKLVTCPFILDRFCEDIDLLLNEHNDIEQIKKVYELYNLTKNIKNYEVKLINCKNDSNAKEHSDKSTKKPEKLMLGNYIFEKKLIEFKDLDKLNMFNNFKDKIAVISDENFKEIVTYFTEVQTRIKIDNKTMTAKNTGLFNQEYLPSETIMYCNVIEFKKLYNEKEWLKEFSKVVNENFNFTLGGNITLGKGHMKVDKVVG